MIYDTLGTFFSGAATMGAFACAVFFLRCWKINADRFFLIFSLAFFILGIERIVFIIIFSSYHGQTPFVYREETPVIYLIRVLAFILILAGIWDKNRRKS